MSEDNKNFQNPFIRDEKQEMGGQAQGQPMYYPYPPMPQAQQGENGQPMPMYYPYPPMPQAQQGENGQPMPMYYPYPPMPQAQQGENGQPMPMYYPYPPMPQAQQGENGQPMPMYYPYPPMPQAQQGENGQPMPMYYPYPPMPQAQQSENGQPAQQVPTQSAVNNTYNQQQNIENAESVKAEPQVEVKQETPKSNASSNPFMTVDNSSTEQNSSADNQVDGRDVFVRQPVIDTSNNEEFGEKDEELENMIVHEPAQNESMFSAPTPVYDPEKGAQEQPANVPNSFMSSMQSMYSSIVASKAPQSTNVSNEPLPNFTPAIESVTENEPQQKEAYFTSAQKIDEPVEVDPSKASFAQQKPQSEAREQQGYSIDKMLQQNAAEKPVQQYNEQQPQAQQYVPQQPQQTYAAQPQADNGGIEITEMPEQPVGDDYKKDQQYWEFMNNLLDRFDDGKVHTAIGMNMDENLTDAEQLQRKFMAMENEVEPDRDSLESFGKNVEKPATERVTITRTPTFIKKSTPDFTQENPDFDDGFGDFDDFEEPKAKREKVERVKKEKGVKKEKAPKIKKEKKASPKSSEKTSSKDSKFNRFLSATLPMKGDSVGEIVRKMVVIVSVLVLLGCGVYFLTYFIVQQQNKSDTAKLAEIMQSSESSADEWSTIHSKYPNTTFPSGMKAKYADLYAMNSQLVGWVKIDGLDIDLPVVQGEDNSYYLKHNFNKEKSKYGCIFVSKDNNIETLDLNTVLFGHRMHSDTQMFTNLKEYATVDGFKKAPIIRFDTLYSDYVWKVYAVFITNGSASEDNGNLLNYTFPNLSSVENYGQFLAEVNQRKLYDTGVDILPTDRILTLSTCTYEFTNARLVVIARQIRPGESTEVDTSAVSISSNPRYPQAWYDENGVSNPYKGYNTWQPAY